MALKESSGPRRAWLLGGALVLLGLLAGAWTVLNHGAERTSNPSSADSTPRRATEATSASNAREPSPVGVEQARQNEKSALRDVRTVLSGQAAYQAANGGFYEGRLACLSSPADCIPGYPPTLPAYLDPQLSSQAPGAGYTHEFRAGPAPPTFNAAISSASSVVSWTYSAIPVEPGRSGLSSFCTDAAARLVRCADGRRPPVDDGSCLVTAGCEVLH